MHEVEREQKLTIVASFSSNDVSDVEKNSLSFSLRTSHQGLSKLLGDAAPSCRRENKFENYFGRQIAVDASMHIYQFLVKMEMVFCFLVASIILIVFEFVRSFSLLSFLSISLFLQQTRSSSAAWATSS